MLRGGRRRGWLKCKWGRFRFQKTIKKSNSWNSNVTVKNWSHKFNLITRQIEKIIRFILCPLFQLHSFLESRLINPICSLRVRHKKKDDEQNRWSGGLYQMWKIARDGDKIAGALNAWCFNPLGRIKMDATCQWAHWKEGPLFPILSDPLSAF